MLSVILAHALHIQKPAKEPSHREEIEKLVAKDLDVHQERYQGLRAFISSTRGGISQLQIT